MPRRPLASRITPLIIAACTPFALAAQVTVVRVPDEPTCPRCAISLRATVTLDSPDDAAADRPFNVSIDKAGRYWMFLEQELPALYSSAGTFVRSVGRKGSGPGEYQFPQFALPVGDSVVIFDPGTRRATVVDASLAAVRSVVVPFQMMSPSVISWPTAVVASVSPSRPREVIPPFRRVSLVKADAEFREFGSTWVFEPALRAWGDHHFFTPSDREGTWAARTGGYQLSEWNADGSLVRALERKVTWFTPETEFRMGAPAKAPEAVIAGIDRDANGLLWVFIRMPAPTWKEAWPAGGGNEVMARKIRYEKLYTTRVEIIDPSAGRVVARQDFDRYMLNSLGNGRVVFFARDKDDLAKTTIAQLTLTGR